MPISFPTYGEDSKPDSPIKKIQQFGMGIPTILSSSPSTSGGQLSDNDWGFDGNNLFIAIGGKTYKVSLTLT